MQTATDTFPAPVLSITLPESLNYASQESDRGTWRHRLVLKPSTLELEVWSNYGGATPIELWDNVVIQLGLIDDGTADLTPLAAALARRAADIRELAGMHSVEWNGQNHVGVYADFDRANELAQGLSDLIDGLELPKFWDASEYYSPVTPYDVIPADFTGTDEALEALAAREVAAARPDAYLEHDDVLRNLRAMWKRSLEDRAEAAAEAEEAE